MTSCAIPSLGNFLRKLSYKEKALVTLKSITELERNCQKGGVAYLYWNSYSTAAGQDILLLFPPLIETYLAHNNEWHIRPKFYNRYSKLWEHIYFIIDCKP